MYDIKNLNIWKDDDTRNDSNDLTQIDITEMELSVRSFNCLRRAGCQTVGDIMKRLDENEQGLKNIRNLGTRSEEEILEKLHAIKARYHRSGNYGGQSSGGGTGASGSGAPDGAGSGVGIRLVRPSYPVMNRKIDSFHLSESARNAFQENDIRYVRDLYRRRAGSEPGWYAVRELFDRVLAGE